MADLQTKRHQARAPRSSAPGTSDLSRPEPAWAADHRPVLLSCVPTFERPKLVQRAIESIVQSAAGAEADVEIIVSDNSPDVSEIACHQALESWSGRSLYVGNRPDIGFNDNYNQCIARAS